MYILSLNNTRITQYMQRANAKNMVGKKKRFVVRALTDDDDSILQRKNNMALIGKSDLFGNKGGCNSFSSISQITSVQERINSRY